MAVSSHAKAWTYTSGGYPSSLHLANIQPPERPAPGHVLVEVKACALNPVDIQIMNLPFWSLPYLSYEKTACSDFSGTILAAPPESMWKAGDEVFGVNMAPFMPASGTLSEVAHVNEAKTTIVKKPTEWSHKQAAGLGCVWLTARTCIELVGPHVKDTKRVVVLGGSSATGMYTVMLAKKRGWEVLSTCSGKNANFVKTMGAEHVVDYTQQSVPERVSAFKPDAIVDCVGGTECLGIANRYVTIVGDKTGRTTMGGSMIYLTHPRMVLRWLWGKYGYGAKYDCIILDQRKEYLEDAKNVLEPEDIVIDSTYAFDDAKAAFERLNTGRARGKVVVEIV